MFTPDEASSIGIIDKVVPLENIEATAREEMEKWLQIPGKLFQTEVLVDWPLNLK